MTASILNHGCDAKQECGHKTHLRMTFNEPRQNVLGSTHLKQCGVTRARASSRSNLVQLSQYDMGLLQVGVRHPSHKSHNIICIGHGTNMHKVNAETTWCA